MRRDRQAVIIAAGAGDVLWRRGDVRRIGFGRGHPILGRRHQAADSVKRSAPPPGEAGERGS